VTRALGLVLPAVLLASACQTTKPADAPVPAAARALAEAADGETLTLIVAALRVHLREDTYRYGHARTPDGRDIFEVSLWKLERLQRLRSKPETELAAGETYVDLVIEFGRARALERLRRYRAAGASYEQVAASGSMLAAQAWEGARVMRDFAEAAGSGGAPVAGEAAERELIDARIARWQTLVAEHRGTTYESLAREEAEAWEQLRVDWFERHASFDKALAACQRLIERNADSKLDPSHLIRLGDLYASAARRQPSRARLGADRPEQYEQLIDRAFAAYELAGDGGRIVGQRREANARIQALLAYHQGVVSRAR
jgi:tetratricopeptide (TPR) repeat protein